MSSMNSLDNGMKVYEIIDENNESYGLFAEKEKAELKRLELEKIAKTRGKNNLYNIYEKIVV